jgi:hypothetical protein
MKNTRRSKKINWFMLGILALPLLAGGAYFWATDMISSFDSFRSPLQDTAPVPGAELGEPLSRRVVIVLMDALRADTALNPDLMPVLASLRQVGASATMTSRPPSFSAPGWATLLTGSWPDINDAQLFNPPDEEHVRTFTQDDIFAAADRAGLNTAVSGYSWFEQMLSNSGVDAGFYTSGEDNAADEEVVANALPWLTGNYQLILIHIDQIDYAGHHEGGPVSENWAAAATRSDALLGEILAQLDLKQDTLIVLADHGQIDKGGHGGNEAVAMTEPFVAAGTGIIPGTYADIKMVDIAPTIAVLLGTNLPASNQGRPLLEMLPVDAEQANFILSALKVQQAQLFNAYTLAIGQSAEVIESDAVVSATQLAMEQARMGRLARERVWRNMITIFFLLLPPYLLVIRRAKKLLWPAGGALIYMLLFNLRYILLDKNTYGLSSIPGQMEFIIYIAITAGIALFIAWLGTMIGQHAFRNGARHAAGSALAFIWVTIYLLAIPTLVNFAVNGYSATWTLPEFTVQFLGFLAVAQGLFVAAIGLLLVGMSALIGKFSKR